MDDWKTTLIGLLGLVLTVLFMLRRRGAGAQPPSPEKPDLVSAAAGSAERLHQGCGLVMAAVILAAVAYLAVVNPLTRIILLSTLGVLLLIWIYAGTVKQQP